MTDRFGGLREFAGVEAQKPDPETYTFFRFDREHPVFAGLPVGFPVSVYDFKQSVLSGEPSGDVLARVIRPMPGFNLGFPPGPETGRPAIVAIQRSKGRVLYTAAPVGAVYSAMPHPDYKRFLSNAIRWAAGAEPSVAVDAPETVEMVAWQDAKRMVVHLVNRTGAGLPQGEGAIMHEVIPVADIKVRAAGTFTRATLQPGNRPLRLTGSAVTIPRLGLWEVVEFVR